MTQPEPMTAVICTCGRPDTIGLAVESLARQHWPQLEILVLDQSVGDESKEIVKEISVRYPTIRYVGLAQRGLSKAYNRAMTEARHQLIAFTDDDCVAPPEWVSVIARAFDQYPEVGLIYGQVLGPTDPEDERRNEGVVPTLQFDGRRLLSHRDGFKVFGMGANFAARRSVLQGLGGFDEVLGGGGPLQSAQDFDLAYRLYKRRGTILLEPEAVVYHYGFRSPSEWPVTAESYGIGVGGFYLKHVRSGDGYAAWLLGKSTAKVAARVAKRLLRRRSSAIERTFLRSVVRGMRLSRRFEIDRQRRLYRTGAG